MTFNYEVQVDALNLIYPQWFMMLLHGEEDAIVKRAWMKPDRDVVCFWLDVDGKQVYQEITGEDFAWFRRPNG